MFHNRFFRMTLLGVLAIGIVVVSGIMIKAADHLDSPNSSESNLDVNDLYVFNQGNNVVFAMTVSPLAGSGAAFNPDGLYQFKLDKERDGIADVVIQVTFDGTGTGQTVQVRGPSAPSVTGPGSNTILSGSSISGRFDSNFTGNGMTVFAGPREDPFFVHLFGDASLTSVLNAAFTAALGTPVGDPNEQTFAFADPASDDLAGANVLAIVVEVPKSAIANALGITTSDTFYAWATTSVKD